MFMMDTEGLNYSSMRGQLEMAKRRFRVEQAGLSKISSRIFQWWLSREVKHNGLKVPIKIERTYWAHSWGTPGWPYLDPLKEIQATGLAMDRMLTTHQAALQEAGDKDFEDVVAQATKERDMLAAAGLPTIIGVPGTTIIDPDDDGEDDKEDE